MALTADWHIHSQNSCDEASLTMADLLREAAAVGVTRLGVTDHLHTPYNRPDVQASRREFDACGAVPGFHFGLEVSCVSRWELERVAAGAVEKPVYGVRSGGPPGAELALALTPEDVREFGIEYVIGGTHWPMYVPFERGAIIREFHRQNLFLACHPLVDIVAHPWWWHGHWRGADGRFTAEPWFDDFGHVPQSMHAELAAALREHRKVMEVNASALLLNPTYPERFRRQYTEHVAWMRAQGVPLSFGSDCHSRHYDADLAAAEAMLAEVGIRDEDLWRLPGPATAPADNRRQVAR